MKHLIIDTDPGVDDAEAIMLASAHPSVEIAALTIVAGNVGLENTSRNACFLAEALGLSMPIYAGCKTPLVFNAESAEYVHGMNGLGDIDLPTVHKRPESKHASVALCDMANERPGHYTLVALGPLTNIALALHLDPQLPSKLERFVVMGGAVTSNGNTNNLSAEFNIFADPEAAHVVFKQWPMLELVDWEATLDHGVMDATVSRWLEIDTPRARLYKQMSALARAYNRKAHSCEEMLTADPLAMAVAIEPEIALKSEMKYVQIETRGDHTRGQTTVDWSGRSGKPANVKIVRKIDQSRFEALFQQGLEHIDG